MVLIIRHTLLQYKDGQTLSTAARNRKIVVKISKKISPDIVLPKSTGVFVVCHNHQLNNDLLQRMKSALVSFKIVVCLIAIPNCDSFVRLCFGYQFISDKMYHMLYPKNQITSRILNFLKVPPKEKPKRNFHVHVSRSRHSVNKAELERAAQTYLIAKLGIGLHLDHVKKLLRCHDTMRSLISTPDEYLRSFFMQCTTAESQNSNILQSKYTFNPKNS